MLLHVIQKEPNKVKTKCTFKKHLSTIKMVYAEKDSPENMKMYSLL